MKPPRCNPRIPAFGLVLTVAGCAFAIALMVAAWRIYPGGYDWMNRDLSTLGRVFTVNGHGHHVNFSVYNFGLLVWGMAAIVFFCSRAMLASSAKCTWRLLICAPLIGLGLAGIGVTPADVPNNLWHVVSSSVAILGFAVVIFAANRTDEPGKRGWAWSLAVMGAIYVALRFLRIPHGGVLFQKLFVLYVYSYMILQSIAMLRRMYRGECRIRPGTAAIAYHFSRIAVWSGCAGMLGLMLTAIWVVPGGFDWHNHWTSRLGNVFLETADQESGTVYPYYMIYAYSLAVGGCSLAAFWSLRSLRSAGGISGAAMLFTGWVMGMALAGIGMAPTSALGLHRLSINLFILTVTAMLVMQLFRAFGSEESFKRRIFWLLLIAGSGVVFHLLGSPYGKLAQKVMILEVVCWLMAQGYDAAHRKKRKCSIAD